MRILGREWDYIATDTTEGPGGNEERMAFVCNTEKIWFRKIAGEVVLPDGQLVVSPKKVKAPKDQEVNEQPEVTTEEARQQFARTPFLVAFQSGWFRFSRCTVHIYYDQITWRRRSCCPQVTLQVGDHRGPGRLRNWLDSPLISSQAVAGPGQCRARC